MGKGTWYCLGKGDLLIVSGLRVCHGERQEKQLALKRLADLTLGPKVS